MNFRPALLILLCLVGFAGCTAPNNSNSNLSQATPSPSSSANESMSLVTLPVLDALLTDETFAKELKTKLQLSDDQLSTLKRVASGEVNRLRATNAEESTGDAAEARDRASREIVAVLGEDKAKQLATLASQYWAGAGEDVGGVGKQAASDLSSKPNAVPADTRVVVNIPAFRMDLFENGNLVKTYKIGIGYPEFPLPQGLRKAQTIIVNPSWTPPDSPWVAKMKDVSPGEKVEAGSKLNPLGPVKIPIGMPSLIHGGKAVAKLGTFASHGCVGLTSAQVKDFAKLLARASRTELKDTTLEKYFADKTTTKTIKLSQPVPVELRYETIVVEDGKLHIYKDVYDENTNTEENLRKVLEAHDVQFDSLSADEKNQLVFALNAMSAHPKPMPSPSAPANANQNANDNRIAKKKTKPEEKKKPKNEFVIELAALSGRGYPAPVNYDTGAGKPAQTIAIRTSFGPSFAKIR
jgi:lipoprotein-anchoring transpeptidase ErfK/SrfK